MQCGAGLLIVIQGILLESVELGSVKLDGGELETSIYDASCSDQLIIPSRIDKRSSPVQCSLDHEREAVRAKASCRTRKRVVRIQGPNDTFADQMTPTHVEVDRCSGECFHWKQSCMPTKTRPKKIPVMLAQCSIQSGRCDKICRELEVEEHVECECQCRTKSHHCSERQIYRKELCSCQCRDLSEVAACYESGRVWDPSKCMCRCPLSTLQQCSSKFIFDFTRSCKCIPEESNDIPAGERSQRSQTEDYLAPSWDHVIIGCLLFVLLLLIAFNVVLVKRIQVLQARLRGRAKEANGTL